MTPTLIVDCSMAMAWCFADESTRKRSEFRIVLPRKRRRFTRRRIVPWPWSWRAVSVD